MRFILSLGWEEGIADLTQRLVRELSAGRRVLWLVTGGSNLPASVKIMGSISDDLSRNLTVMLADERYGAPGHADSNWAQLMDSGFQGKHATLLPLLQAGDSFERAAERYNQLAGQAFNEAEVTISQIGIGADGHVAGILPESPAARETTAMVIAYDSPPYTRLTMTFPALQRITADYSFAFGENKRQTLTMLEQKQLDPIMQPAQIFKQLPEAYIYNDQIGEHK